MADYEYKTETRADGTVYLYRRSLTPVSLWDRLNGYKARWQVRALKVSATRVDQPEESWMPFYQSPYEYHRYIYTPCPFRCVNDAVRSLINYLDQVKAQQLHETIVASHPLDPDDPCICTLRERLVGDGCEFCNPDLNDELNETDEH